MAYKVGQARRCFLQFSIKFGIRNRVRECGEQIHKMALSSWLQSSFAGFFGGDEREENQRLSLKNEESSCEVTL